METKKIVESLRCCASYKAKLDVDYRNVLREASCRLEELEKHNEAMMKKLCDKEDLVREAEGRFYELEKELDTLKNAKKPEPEWISVEDRLPEEKEKLYLVYRKDGSIAFAVFYNESKPYWSYDDVTHWMPLPEPPKPKEPTFKDVFLEKFPKASTNDKGAPKACRALIFGEDRCCYRTSCSECWNQPYFEAEEEGSK